MVAATCLDLYYKIMSAKNMPKIKMLANKIMTF